MVSAIYDRRSTRKFLDKPLSKKDITDIIQSGMKAPSSKNRQLKTDNHGNISLYREAPKKKC